MSFWNAYAWWSGQTPLARIMPTGFITSYILYFCHANKVWSTGSFQEYAPLSLTMVTMPHSRAVFNSFIEIIFIHKEITYLKGTGHDFGLNDRKTIT